MQQVLNLDIMVYDYKIEDSKRKANTKLLTLDFELNGERRILFTSAVILQQLLQKTPQDYFPFKTKIVLKDQHLEFV